MKKYIKYIWLVPLLFGLNVILIGCDERRRQPVAERAPSPSTALNSSMSDSDLAKAVRAHLENDPQLKEANLSVNADAERNEITLSGTVRSRAAREKGTAPVHAPMSASGPTRTSRHVRFSAALGD